MKIFEFLRQNSKFNIRRHIFGVKIQIRDLFLEYFQPLCLKIFQKSLILLDCERSELSLILKIFEFSRQNSKLESTNFGEKFKYLQFEKWTYQTTEISNIICLKIEMILFWYNFKTMSQWWSGQCVLQFDDLIFSSRRTSV